jgi:hypothetical protein
MRRVLEQLQAAGSFKINRLPKGVYTKTMLALCRRDLVRLQGATWILTESTGDDERSGSASRGS